MEQQIALVIGATGLVGSKLVSLLLEDDRFSKVIVFVRRTTGIHHPKLQEHLISFDRTNEWQPLVKGNVLFSALGTTLRQAGSQEAQYLIDYTYQFNFAEAAAANGVPVYVLVSSAMANERSRIFYTRMKGELETAVRKLPFRNIHILQPGMLTGPRKEKRTGEAIGIRLIRFLNMLGIARKQRPISDATVARAMINAAFRKKQPIEVHALLDVFTLAGEA